MDRDALTSELATRLAALADPERAAAMGAYMKTDMPFYGVRAPEVRSITRDLARNHPARDHVEYIEAVTLLWGLPHREEKYAAIGYAQRFPTFIEPASMDLYRMLVVQGAWWDFVDTIAVRLVGGVLEGNRATITPLMRSWSTDPDPWIRRTSIICQLGSKQATDTSLLADACVVNLADTDFFIRKAIGWALREFAKTNPDWVRAFVDTHVDHMSGLSIREATKHLGR